jgi:Zn-dependent protease/predicted transcriptional regulator
MAATPNGPHASRRRGSWSWRVGVIAGIPIRIHLTLALLLAWIAFAHTVGGLGPTATLLGLMLVVLVFVIVAVHELGHALMARRFGVHTREILLLPIGGIASLERMPARPAHELAIAIVGPAINLVIAGLLWAGISLAGGETDIRDVTTLGEAFVTQLLWINIVLAVFNLIPAFPMDGGRVLRALLSMRLGRERATDVAAGLGKTFAVLLGVVGLFYNPWLVLIAVVIWFGARHEAELVHVRAAIADVPVRLAMNSQIDTISSDEALEEAARLLVTTGQNQLPIVDDGQTVGVLTRGDIAAGIATSGPDAKVTAAPHHDAITIAPTESLDTVFDRIVETPDAVAVVVDRGIPIGIVTSEQLATFVALRTRPPAPH